eukprot:550944-Prymnesium_polylepis.1
MLMNGTIIFSPGATFSHASVRNSYRCDKSEPNGRDRSSRCAYTMVRSIQLRLLVSSSYCVQNKVPTPRKAVKP